jgi:hypothetical protein
MAEKDWYGPFANWTMRHLHISTGLLGGLLFTIAGLIGYDTGKRWSTAIIPEETRWMGEILWHEVIIGLVAFGYACFQYRLLQAERAVERKEF